MNPQATGRHTRRAAVEIPRTCLGRERRPLARTDIVTNGQRTQPLAKDFARSIAEEVRRCLEQPVTTTQDNTGDEVLLDKEFGGCRLLLIRHELEKPSVVNLSPREIEIARMISRGHPNKMIAAVLSISSWTVGTHIRRIFAKLRVTSRAAMVTRLIGMNLGEVQAKNHR
jgi:DNA-binding CsgD family transcriptional regulator